MFLQSISLFNYKNFADARFELDAKINCFVGKNGVGKTNVLDAIYHLANGKSYFNPLAVQNIKHGEDFFVIEGVFEKNKRSETINCSLKKGQKKILKRNGKLYEKFSEHVGQIPLVIISPADADLITEGSETRRKFMDSVISQLDNSYLHQLIQYQKTVSQRNALLKFFALNRTFDATTLSIYDAQLAELGPLLFEKEPNLLPSLFRFSINTTKPLPTAPKRFSWCTKAICTKAISWTYCKKNCLLTVFYNTLLSGSTKMIWPFKLTTTRLRNLAPKANKNHF